MTFAQKLVFLMNLTSTSNKQLADAVAVDPSLISLLRTGRREPKRNNIHIKKISTFFSKKCEGNYQRVALSEAMGRKFLQTQMSTEDLATLLYDWLTNNQSNATDFLGTYDRFSFTKDQKSKKGKPKQKAADEINGSINFAYYGNEGRRGAFSAFVSHLLLLDTPGTVLFSSDESTEWFFEDPIYLSQMKEQVKMLQDKGFRLRRIVPTNQSIEQAFDSIKTFMPMYLSGKSEGFYYPHMRDSVYKRTVIALPNVASIISTSIGDQSISRATIFTQDARFTNAICDEFNDYLKKCRPIMKTYSTGDNLLDLQRCLMEFDSCKDELIQESTSLSAITSPIELIHLSAESLPHEESEIISTTLSSARLYFLENLEKHRTVDIHAVATPEDVRAGIVPISTSYLRPTSLIYHTPKTYSLHLKSILNLLENYENYHAVLIPRAKDNKSIMVKGGNHARIILPGIPLTVFEVLHPRLPEAYREYLFSLANSNAPYEDLRQDTMLKIWQLIQELKYD